MLWIAIDCCLKIYTFMHRYVSIWYQIELDFKHSGIVCVTKISQGTVKIICNDLNYMLDYNSVILGQVLIKIITCDNRDKCRKGSCES